MNLDTELTANELEATGDYKVLRRFIPRSGYGKAPDDTPTKIAMIIDTETTSLKKQEGKIIEIGYVLVSFCQKTGRLYEILDRYNGLQDPGFPLSAETIEVTGITDADLAGKSFDMEKIVLDVTRADILIAHNAPFDRGFLEMLDPVFEGKWWACSLAEVLWQKMGIGSAKMDYLAAFVAGVFYNAHRALVDTEVTLEVLSKPAPDGEQIFSHLIARSRTTTYRVWATGAPIEKKDVLKDKKNGYKWSDGSDPEYPIKAWYKDGVTDFQAELDWLAKDIYHWGDGKRTVINSVILDKLTGRERYTHRYAARETISLIPPSKDTGA